MSLFKDQHPEIMMSATQVSCFLKYLNKSDSVFEWGSGGSTYNYCNYVNEYYSVEHDFKWYTHVNQIINERNIKNVNYKHVSNHGIILDELLDKESPNLLRLTQNVQIKDGKYYAQTRGGDDWHCYINYINSISSFNKKFDKILVDGRARVFCAYKALDYIKDDGILYVHDFKERVRYRTVLDYYDVIEECIDEGWPGSLIVLKKK
jgi:hypothetical protein